MDLTDQETWARLSKDRANMPPPGFASCGEADEYLATHREIPIGDGNTAAERVDAWRIRRAREYGQALPEGEGA